MRITRIEIENIRCFEHAVIDFTAAGEPSAWNLILGDNGTGKSTLLQCLALGLASPRDTGALLQDTQARWLRHGATRGSVAIDFVGFNSTRLTIEQAEFGEYATVVGDLPWHNLFVCGYGAGRRALNDRSYEGYFLREAVLGLFDPEARLQNAELVLRRMGAPQQTRVLQQIDCLLMLPQGSTRLSHSGLEISGPWGSSAPEWSLGDGYKTTLAWVVDLIGWALLRNPEMLESGIEGIVLIDEIEQHLHPHWQRRILGLLRRQFPKVQFLATTHSSLCVLGTTDLGDDEVSIVHLRQTEGEVDATGGIQPPRGQRADQILTSYLFGLETTSDDQTKAEIERLSRLLGRADLDVEERAEIPRLRERLSQKLGSGETELERRAAEKIRDELDEDLEPTRSLGRSGGLAAAPPEEALDLEVKRQFQELLRKL